LRSNRLNSGMAVAPSIHFTPYADDKHDRADDKDDDNGNNAADSRKHIYSSNFPEFIRFAPVIMLPQHKIRRKRIASINSAKNLLRMIHPPEPPQSRL